VPQFLKLEDRPVALDDFRTNARLAESSGRLGQAEEAVELGDHLDEGHPGRIVFVELAVELLEGGESQSNRT
jgi:hypothetical protein